MTILQKKATVEMVALRIVFLNFQPLEVVSRYRDTQLQVVENYLYLFDLRQNIYKSWF